MGIVFKIYLVYTDKPMGKSSKNIIVWYESNEAICYQQIRIQYI